jgi:hypothetical protein
LEIALEKITRQPVASADFDEATVNLLDQNINLFSPAQWVRIARVLELDIASARRECRQDD